MLGIEAGCLLYVIEGFNMSTFVYHEDEITLNLLITVTMVMHYVARGYNGNISLLMSE